MAGEQAPAANIMGAIAAALLLVAAGLVLYGLWMNHVLSQTPREALAHVDEPLTPERIRRAYDAVKERGIDWYANLPPWRDRRYVIVGGSGLVGGQIALHLLKMGAPPRAIRLLDIRRPARSEFLSGAASELPFFPVDITSESATSEALDAPWHESVAGLPLTVFHTAAVIRPFERDQVFYQRCSRVNVAGTANVLSAAQRAGAGVFIYTSSSNAGSRGTSWLFPPWLRQPRNFAQLVGEDDFSQPMMAPHEFPSTYAQSKAEAERLVCGADNARGMRTGAIRPGNAVYGHKDDNIVGRMLGMGRMPTACGPWVQNWVNVRNVAQAHVLLEAALLGEHADQVAGRPFMVSDRGAPLRFRDVYTILDVASVTGFRVDYPPPLLMLLAASGIEAYCLLLAKMPWLRRLLREPGEPVCLIQPALFSSSLSFITNTTAARRAPEEGGLGYRPSCTTLEGMCAQLVEWNEWIESKRCGTT